MRARSPPVQHVRSPGRREPATDRGICPVGVPCTGNCLCCQRRLPSRLPNEATMDPESHHECGIPEGVRLHRLSPSREFFLGMSLSPLNCPGPILEEGKQVQQSWTHGPQRRDLKDVRISLVGLSLAGPFLLGRQTDVCFLTGPLGPG